MVIPPFPVDERLIPIVRRIRESGGRAMLVGGFVRDALLGNAAKDADVEVYGLDEAQLLEVLGEFGDVLAFGQSFGVVQIKGLPFDFSLPRRDSKVSAGHRGFDIAIDPSLSFDAAAKRRDFRMNSIGYDPLTHTLCDPYDGQRDLRAGTLRVTDADTFVEDPLRGLRAAQFIARFELTADPALIELCRTLPIDELSMERVLGEFRKMIVLGRRPSLGLEFLRACELTRFFPALEQLTGDKQSAFEDTCASLDAAVAYRDSFGEDTFAEVLMWALCCHRMDSDGSDASPGGELFLAGLGVAKKKRDPALHLIRIERLTDRLLTPAPTGASYRKLARIAAKARLGWDEIAAFLRSRVSSEDDTNAKGDRTDRIGAGWIEHVGSTHASPPVVTGKHLVARGWLPGTHFRAFLEHCTEIQDETGSSDPEYIIELAERRMPNSG